jgi:hypothetical protein
MSFPPRRRTVLHDAVLKEILEERVDPRHNRHNPRAVKRKMSKFPIRPRGVKSMPLINIQEAIRVVK